MTKRTPQIETAILEGFADGRSILSLCREHGIAVGGQGEGAQSRPRAEARRFDCIQFGEVKMDGVANTRHPATELIALSPSLGERRSVGVRFS